MRILVSLVANVILAVSLLCQPAHAADPKNITEITITTPDDWHYHFRDDDRLPVTTEYVAKTFRRAIAMPNLKPPVTTTEQALAYRDQILSHVPQGVKFEPLMTLYLTDNLPPEEIYKAKKTGLIVACKYYPAGATTNSDAGV